MSQERETGPIFTGESRPPEAAEIARRVELGSVSERLAHLRRRAHGLKPHGVEVDRAGELSEICLGFDENGFEAALVEMADAAA